jgi:cell division protein FtsX
MNRSIEINNRIGEQSYDIKELVTNEILQKLKKAEDELEIYRETVVKLKNGTTYLDLVRKLEEVGNKFSQSVYNELDLEEDIVKMNRIISICSWIIVILLLSLVVTILI